MTRDQCFFNMELEPPYGDMVPAASMIHWSRCASRGMPWDHEWSWMISWSHGMYDHFDIYIYLLIDHTVDECWWHPDNSWLIETYWAHIIWAHITMLSGTLVAARSARPLRASRPPPCDLPAPKHHAPRALLQLPDRFIQILHSLQMTGTSGTESKYVLDILRF